MPRINIKPLSVNRAWKGRRFKTPEYKAYAKELSLKLPRKLEIPEGPLKITFIFGLSNSGADYDNCIKQTQDLISKKYGFNDCRITHAVIHKAKVSKGAEYMFFHIEQASHFFEALPAQEAA